MCGTIIAAMGQKLAVWQQEARLELEPSWILDTLKNHFTSGVKGAFWRILTAVLIVVIGFRLVRAARRILKKTFDRMSLEENVNKFLLTSLNACMYALVIFIAAEKLGVPSASIVTLMGSAGVAIGLSLKESLSNVAGGILIMVTRPFILQDYIICKEKLSYPTLLDTNHSACSHTSDDMFDRFFLADEHFSLGLILSQNSLLPTETLHQVVWP